MDQNLIHSAVGLASQWQNRACEKISQFENNFHSKMQMLVNHPTDKVFLIELMDQSFRTQDVSRIKSQIDYLFSKYGMAGFFTNTERFLIFLFQNIGTYIPKLSIPLFVENIRSDTKTVVLPGEDKLLNKHLQNRHMDNTRVNLNFIGEAVLGEIEAQNRIKKYLSVLENPNIDYISIKISTIESQINPLSFDQTVGSLVPKLKRIFLKAKQHPFKNSMNKLEYKFVNLDMEEYRDLSITLSAFKKALEDPELMDYRAGIVLQAYLPDAHLWQKDLTNWAKQRVSRGGVPIKLRLVKGANLEMEKTEASQRGWNIATYTEKTDTDSNYKIMVHYGLDPENAEFVHIGVASHNLFELAYAFELAKKNRVLNSFSIEMLEGMSESSRKAIHEISGQTVTLYAPVAEREQFTNAIAYLVRRLDENTGKDNFIRYSFGLKLNSPQWNKMKDQFIESFGNLEGLFVGQKRKQNRFNESFEKEEQKDYARPPGFQGFVNEPDTDFILEKNRRWAEQIKETWQKKEHNKPSFRKATAKDLQKAVEIAREDPDGWRQLPLKQRNQILSRVARELRKRRGDLIGVTALEVGKTFVETDIEVSEAVDFVEFYPRSVNHFHQSCENLRFQPKGTGLVVSPWNFPIAIPIGGITAALATGNTVIFKPASSAVLCAIEICRCFWSVGVSEKVLQLTPCSGSLANEHLVKNKGIDFVILTGGEQTATKMLKSKPDLFLTAETGGKNATIVTAMADRDQAIKNITHSAFSNSGQKCSATSLLVLENEIYFDRKFQEALVDSARSLKVGSPWNFENKIAKLIGPPEGALKQALENCEEGESWVLRPEFIQNNQRLLKPSIKWGVKEDSFCHKTELFGPVLSVMRADNLEEAVKIVNRTGYGLTSGIESLDEREINYWKKHIRAGNLYINRGTTGAIVLRQPFGGVGKSAVGSGRKVGIFNYITQFMKIEDQTIPKTTEVKTNSLVNFFENLDTEMRYAQFREELKKLQISLQSYLFNLENEFSRERDFCKVRGEDNIFRYSRLGSVALRIGRRDSLFESMARILVAKVCHVKIRVSFEPERDDDISKFLFRYSKDILEEGDLIKRESERDFVKCFPLVDRIFHHGKNEISDFILNEAVKNLKIIIRNPPLMEGRLELLNFFEEQSISHSFHRYGNLGSRELQNK